MTDLGSPQKPRAVLAFQIVAWIVSAILAIGVVRYISAFTQVQSVGSLPLPYWLGLLGRSLGLAVLVLALFSLRRRGATGRFAGMVAIALLFVAYVNHVFISPAPPIIPRLQYDNPAFGYTVERIFNLLFATLLLYWIYAYGLSAKARAYFNGKPAP